VRVDCWNINRQCCRGTRHSQAIRDLNLLLWLIFIACASALTGSFLARRSLENTVERGTTLIGEGARESSAPRADDLTLAGHLIAPLDETKHFKMIGTPHRQEHRDSRALTTLSAGETVRHSRSDAGYLDLFHDPAGGDVILNPFDARAASWDLFAEIDQPHDADQLARSLIPPTTARTAIGATIPHVLDRTLASAPSTGDRSSWPSTPLSLPPHRGSA